MNPYSLSGLLIAVSSLAVGILVLWKNPHARLSKVWFGFTVATAVWGAGIIWIGFSKDYNQALWLWRISYALGIIWIAPLFYHFICTFLELKRPVSIFIHYGLGLAFACNVGSTLFFARLRWLFDSFYYVRAGPLYIAYLVWWLGLVLYSHVELIRIYRQVDTSKKIKIKYFFLATVVGFLGGNLSYLPKLGIDIYPWGTFTVFLYPIIVSYAMLKFQLMDVRIFIRRAGLIVGIYAGLVLLTVPFLITFHHHVNSALTHSSTFMALEVFIMGAILSVGPFLYATFLKQSSYFHEHTLASLTHELKSPLANIESALEFLSEQRKIKPQNAQEDAYWDMIERNSTRLNQFVNDLLQAFKGEGKNMLVKAIPVDLNEMCQEQADYFSTPSKSKNLTVQAQLPAEKVLIPCDKDKIRQVLSNLLSNAVKFSEQGVVVIKLASFEKNIQIDVIDQGKGIPASEIPYIFDRFFQGEAGRHSKGTGIGLSIAKAWVDAHGGKIWAESNGEGKGTTISFTLPKS